MGHPSSATQPRPEPRFSIEVLYDPARDSTLADDTRKGLSASPKSLPPKHFYDERGSRLFDAICDLPEYYPTRAEIGLLEQFAGPILEAASPTDVIELGSGTSRKTRILFDAAARTGLTLRYHPIDVCEEVLRSSGEDLLAEYEWLSIRALAADYEREIDHLPDGERRLVAFLGSTIGNFVDGEASAFLSRITHQLRRGETLLLGVDLVKSTDRVERAYNDSAGVTADFNRNVLRVINRELGGRFDPERFDHVAFFNEESSQIEMHLRARSPHRVEIDDLGLDVAFREGETILTEVSRKFTRERIETIFDRCGLSMLRWDTPDDGAFALTLAERV